MGNKPYRALPNVKVSELTKIPDLNDRVLSFFLVLVEKTTLIQERGYDLLQVKCSSSHQSRLLVDGRLVDCSPKSLLNNY